MGVRKELESLHISACDTCPPVAIDPLITRYLSQGYFWRSPPTAAQRRSRGTLLIVPPNITTELEAPNPYLTLRYRFLDEEPRRRYRTLLVQLMQRLGTVFAPGAPSVGTTTSTLRTRSVNSTKAWVIRHLLASLASVDGAALLTQRLELLGFGVEIAEICPPSGWFERALDIEADTTIDESTEGVGTRHRSAYRLCAQLPDVLALGTVPGWTNSARQEFQRPGHLLGPTQHRRSGPRGFPH